MKQSPSTYKVRLTLPDDSTVELYDSEIKQASQEMGDVRTIHDICGIHPLFGPCYCPKCKVNGNLDGCGRHFVVDTQRDEPGLIEVQLKNGRVLYAKDCERVSDNKYEQVVKSIEQFVTNINQDLQISSPSKLLESSPFRGLAGLLPVMHGLAIPHFLSSHHSQLIDGAIEMERVVIEIAALTGVTTDEVKEFYKSHNYSLEFIKAAVQAGAKLNEEDIKRTMEERVGYSIGGWPNLNDPALTSVTSAKQEDYTFLVILPNGDRREVKAAYMEVDGSTLYFEDDNRETILAFGPGHWVWAVRVEDSKETT